jgi:hypothetical protein
MLDSPYKMLAADVDGSGSISVLDLSFMRRLILGSSNAFPAGLWRFVPSDYVFTTNILNPWNAPTNRVYKNRVSSNLTGQHFAAVKLGDVNASWSQFGGDADADSKGKSLQASVNLQLGSATNVSGTSVVVPVSVSGFKSVTSAQGTFAWDPAVLRFVGTESYGLGGLAAGNFGTAFVSNGMLSFSWDDPEARGTARPDGAAIFALRFELIGPAGSSSTVTLVDSITRREAGVDFSAAPLQSVDGQVSIVGEGSSATSDGGSQPGLRLTTAKAAGGAFGLNVSTISGKNYILEFSDVMPATKWTALPPVAGDGQLKTLNDPAPAPTQRFYRVRVE